MSVVHELVPFAVFGFPSAVAVAFGWFRHRERLAAARADAADAADVALLEARLARMEQVLDAMAVETERVSEGQRFVARLLAERPVAQESARGRTTASPSRAELVTSRP